jgi:hypothetical protein
MMSTAILMAMGAEQSSKQPVAHDVETLEGPSFAQTLDARVEIGPTALEKDPTVATPPETSNGKMEPATKNLVGIHESTNVAKPRVGVGQEIRTLGENKDITQGKTVPLHTATGVGPRFQAKTKDTETQIPEVPVNTEETPAAPNVASTDQLQAGEAIPLEGQGDKTQIQLSNVQTVVQREALAADKNQEAAPVKKAATKTQDGDSSQLAAAAKNGAVTVPPIANETAHVAVVPVSSPTTGHNTAAPVVMVAPVVQLATSKTELKPENDTSGAGSRSAPVAASLSFGVTPLSTPSDDSANKNLVHGAKTSVPDREATVAAPGDPAAAAKPDVQAERSHGVAANAGNDGDTKTRLTSEPSVPTVHVLVPGADATAGAATSIVSGPARLPGAGGGGSTTSLSNGLREQDGSGSAARSTEPMQRTLSATPTALEVGIPDGTHGWLKVRAEMTDGGVVNASVSAASAASQEMLHRELPSLTAYLQSEKVAVNTVVVHATASAESRSTPGGVESGGSGQAPRQGSDGAEQQGSVKAAAEGVKDVTSYQGLHGVDEDGTLPLATYGSGGSWLSVRA